MDDRNATMREDLMIPGLAPSKSMSTNPFDNESMGEDPVEELAHSDLTDSVTGSSQQYQNQLESSSDRVTYSMRGGLMSGKNVIDAEQEMRNKKKKIKSSSSSPKREGSGDKDNHKDDLESGTFPPDSDYASRGPNRSPKSIWDTPSVTEEIPAKLARPPPPSNPFVVSSIDDGREVEPAGKRRKYLRILVGVTVIVFFLAIVAVLFIIRSANDNKSKGKPRQVALDAILEQASSPEALTTTGTPQNRARHWLLHEDSLYLDPSKNATEDQVIQRYSLATLYFSTGGDMTWDTNNWLQGGECDGNYWDHIDCNENQEVRALAFDDSGLSGKLPPEVGHLLKLVNLIIKNNEALGGTIPAVLGHLTDTEQIGITHTGVEGSIPPELFRATNLRYLNLQNNKLDGTIPTDIGVATSLEKVILSNNNMDGTVPWGSLPSRFLKLLSLGENKFTGPMDPLIDTFSELNYLYLENNQFSGSIPTQIGDVGTLRSINFDHNAFNSTIPRQIGRLHSLEYLSMQYNQLVGAIPPEVQHLTKLQTLALGDNRLVGALPDLYSLNRLENLYLFGNELTGVLPAYIFDLPSIEILFLSSNNFTGPIFFTSRSREDSRLKGLYLSDNKFQGPIPMALCQFHSLEAVFFDENELTGGIPACFSQLKELSQLYLFNNQLYGDIPNELSVLLSLEGLGLEGNDFGGSMPEGICQLADLNSMELWTDCGGDTPEIVCDCCSVCCPSSECGTVSIRRF